MPTPLDPKRLPGLKKAMDAFGEDEWASQKQLADIYGVTNARFTTLVKNRFPSFPAHQRRDDKTHWYPARAAVQSMIQYMEDSARGKQAQARRHSAVLGMVEETRDGVEPEVAPLTAAELDRMASAQTRIWKLRKDQGLYVLTSEVQRIARGVNAMLTREVMNLVNELDPNGEMDPKARQRLSNRCREVVLKMHDMLGRYLEDDDDGNDDQRHAGAAVVGTGTGGNLRRRGDRTRQRGMASAA